jgi:hypothetical protein
MNELIRSLTIQFEERAIPVHFYGTDQKSIPGLLQALKRNKLTIATHALKEHLDNIDLFASEAILHSSFGGKHRLPIF